MRSSAAADEPAAPARRASSPSSRSTHAVYPPMSLGRATRRPPTKDVAPRPKPKKGSLRQYVRLCRHRPPSLA